MQLSRAISLCLCLAFASTAQPPAGEESQPEKSWTLQYGVEWRMIRAGTARWTWSPEQEGYQTTLDLQSTGLVSKLYKVEDEYRSTLGKSYCVASTSIAAQEGNRKHETSIQYRENKASYLQRDLKRNRTVLQKEMAVPPCVMEYLGALNFLRKVKLDVGQGMNVPMSDGKKVANVRVDAQEKEQVKTPLGAFKTQRYEVQMFNDVLVNRKARLFVWLTDDARKLPVQLRFQMQFLIGTITLQLEKEEL